MRSLAKHIVFILVVLSHLCAVAAGIVSLEIISPTGSRRMVDATAMPITAPALDQAVSELRQNYVPKFTVRHTYLTDESIQSCPDYINAADFMVADYYYRRTEVSNVTVFAFSGCGVESVGIARLAAAWNELVLIGIYPNVDFRNRQLYPNVIQGSPLRANLVTGTMVAFIRKFNWKTVYVVCDKSGPGFYLAVLEAAGLTEALSSMHAINYVVYTSTLSSDRSNATKPFTDLLQSIRKVARVVFYYGHASSLRLFMIAARENNMTTHDYVYIALDVYEYPTWLYGNCTWQNNDDQDPTAFLAFQRLFVVSPTSTLAKDSQRSRNELFTDLIRRSKMDYNFTYQDHGAPTPAILSTYAIVVILGQVLDAALSGGRNQSALFANSAQLADQISGHSFKTKAGELSFDARGERIIRFDVKRLNRSTGLLEPVLRQLFNDPGDFVVLHDDIWQDGGPPPNEPLCGFSGLKGSCSATNSDPYERTVWTVCLVAVGFLALFVALRLYARKSHLTNITRHLILSASDLVTEL